MKQSDQNTFKEFFLSRWYFTFIAVHLPEKELGRKVNDLDATEDGEASEESHRAADQTQLGHQGHLRHHICKRRCYNVEHI